MTTDRLLERLSAGAEQLDEAIGRAAFGAVPLPARHRHVHLVIAAIVVAGLALTATVVRAQLGDDGQRAARSPSAGGSDVPVDSVPPVVTAVLSPEDVARNEINLAWNFGSYGTEGDRLRHLIVQDRLAACMNGLGFEYPQLPFVPSRTDLHGLWFLPPPPSVGQVELRGYGAFVDGPPVGLLPPGPFSEIATFPDHDAAVARIDELAGDPAWSAAYYGGDHNSGECMIEAWEFLDDNVGKQAQDMRQRLSPEYTMVAGPLLDSSAGMRPLIRQWSHCMQVGGFDVADRGALAEEFFRGPGSEPTSREIQAALWDLHCREATNWDELRREIVMDAIAEFHQQHVDDIAELEELVAVENAAAERVAAELGLI